MCDCIETANKLLASQNTQFDLRECLNMKTGKVTRVLTVPTRRINAKSRKRVYVVIAKFCPMCGEKRAKE